MHRLLMREDQPLKQVTGENDDKTKNSDQDLIPFWKTIFSKNAIYFRQAQGSCMKNITGYLKELKLTHTVSGVPFALKLYEL